MRFCYDCSDRGYDMCFCKPIKQPNIKFVSEIGTTEKITISYEIDRVVTIKESELRNILEGGLGSYITTNDIIDLIFGGGENE